MADIDDKALEHLYALARIEPQKDKKKRKKLLEDISKILEHFEELKEVDTKNVEPMAGGSFLKNIQREDTPRETSYDQKLLTGQFPETKNGYLKTPPVF